jgi:hypothetical protein
VNWRFWRHLLIVLGAYFLAMSLQPLIMAAQTLMHVGVGYTDNVVSELFAALVGEISRAIAGALGMVLIWYALGPALARRWMWTLAGVFAFFSSMTALQMRFSAHPEYGWMTIKALLSGVACVLTGLALPRVAPGGPGDDVVHDETTPQRGRTVALVAACSAIAAVAGSVITALFLLSVMHPPSR